MFQIMFKMLFRSSNVSNYILNTVLILYSSINISNSTSNVLMIYYKRYITNDILKMILQMALQITL